MALPIGSIYTSNITPDKTYGIGAYTFADFDRAVRFGVAKGHTLYPAMPYVSYAMITSEDMQALYAYFEHGVTPAPVANIRSEIAFPLSMRWPLTFWRLAFAPAAKPFDAARYKDPQIAKGAYFVQGLGHCGECHTPRGIALQLKAQSEKHGKLFLAGADVENWYAPNLRNEGTDTIGAWSVEQIASFLLSGTNHAGMAFGSMGEVIANSTQFLTAEDATDAGKYLKSLGGADSGTGAYSYDEVTERALADGDATKQGALVYLNNCAACHRPDGKGYEGVFPALAGNPVAQSRNPLSLISIVLSGSVSSRTAQTPAQFTMPSFAWRLSDQQIADVLTFVRSSWGNDAHGPVGTGSITSVRSSLRTPAPATPQADAL